MTNHSKPTRRKSSSVTIVDVARESGVSYSTVSRVLSGYEFVSEEARSKVMAAANRLGYVVNLQARSLAGGRSHVVGLLVPGLDNGYINEVTRGIDEELAKVGYSMMLYTTHHQRGRENEFVNTIANGLSDGLLLVVPMVSNQYLDALQAKKFPYVLVDQGDTSGRSTIVDATNWQGAYDATAYLYSLGHRRIAHIRGRIDLPSARDRFEGYKSALADLGLPFDPALTAEGDFYQQSAYQASCVLLDQPNPPTAIFASNDLMAFGALQAAGERGLHIPDDLSVIGFDDIPQASMMHPRLTTISQPLEQMGRVGVQLLLEQLDQPGRAPRRVTLATRLIERESCGRVPNPDHQQRR